MASRKVYVDVTVKVILDIDEGKSVNEVLENMDYEFSLSKSDAKDADLLDTEITGWEITDSK